MKKRKLEAEIDYDFSLIGMISPLKDYKLAWTMNKLLELQLSKEKDIEIDFLKSQRLVISNFLYETEHSSVRLLKNKSVDQLSENPTFLLPELNRFDYLLVIKGFNYVMSPNFLKEKLAAVPQIQFVQSFPLESLKSKENLIF